jgi:hypothetical protein
MKTLTPPKFGEAGIFWQSAGMWDQERGRLNDEELKGFFDRLFPHGFAGSDVVAEIAPEGWEKSPMVACFHPSVERVFEEQLQMHRNIASLGEARREQDPEKAKEPEEERPEPTLEELKARWEETPIKEDEEVTELVGQCLWDIFSDNHEVIAADDRVVDIGSFRGASAFLDEYITGKPRPQPKTAEDFMAMLKTMDYMRFYMGTIWTSGRADLTPIYLMIFRRIKGMGGDWEYHFPELGIVDLGGGRSEEEKPEEYSPSESFGREQEEQEREAEVEKMRSELAEGNAEARRQAMDRPPPKTVNAYVQIYGRDPKGWPPV